MRFVRFQIGDRHTPAGGHDSTSPSSNPARWADLRNPNIAQPNLVRPTNPPAHPPAHPHSHTHLHTHPRLNLLLSWAGWQTDSVADRLPTFLEPMGIRSLRARSAKEAERVIRSQPVHIAIVDLGLPMTDDTPPPHQQTQHPSRATTSASSSSTAADEAGPRLLELLRRLDTQPPTVVIKSSATRRDEHRQLGAALRSEAFAVVERAAADLEGMLRILQRCLARHYADRWPATQNHNHPDNNNNNPHNNTGTA